VSRVSCFLFLVWLRSYTNGAREELQTSFLKEGIDYNAYFKANCENGSMKTMMNYEFLMSFSEERKGC
jgi:hypothetical protein